MHLLGTCSSAYSLKTVGVQCGKTFTLLVQTEVKRENKPEQESHTCQGKAQMFKCKKEVHR